MPSNWELLGYEFPIYCNWRYPFTMNPLGGEFKLWSRRAGSSCGVYVTNLDINN